MKMMERIAINEPLIKFQNADIIELLRKGHLYAKTLEYYRNIEHEDDATIKDELDGLFFIPEGKLLIPDKGKVSNINQQAFKTTISDDCAFCMFGIQPQTETFKFTKKQAEKIRSFGDTALIILDRDEFIKRVLRAAEQRNIIGYFGQVKYYDPSSYPYKDIMISITQDIHNIAFWKRNIYSYLQEWRFIFDTQTSNMEHLDLDIGDIDDISYVCTADTAFKIMVEKKV